MAERSSSKVADVSTPFAGLTVLEYADFIAGPYCGKLLADLGARSGEDRATGNR